jgi:hypothetical protein
MTTYSDGATNTCDKIFLDGRYKKLESNPDARLISFISVPTDLHIRSNGFGKAEGLSAQYLEQHDVPRQGEIPRPRLLCVSGYGSDRVWWEIGDPRFDFADHGFAMDR